MRTYIIREIPDENRVQLAFSVDAMPTEGIADYSDLGSALAANPDLEWEDPDEEDAGDILKVAYLA